jgi:adenylosuccinate lyase
MLERFRGLVEGLVVRPERMAENIAAGHGLHASSRLLTALVESGLARTDAYAIVQRNALRAADERISLRALVEADPAVAARLSPEVIERCFDDRAALVHVDIVIRRLAQLER